MARTSALKALLYFVILFSANAYGQAGKPVGQYEGAKKRWVDSVYASMHDTERIGQLFMVAAYSGGKDYNEEAVTKLVADRRVGGLIFMQGTPEAQAVQNNKYQAIAQVPLLIGMDAEWGLGMRLTGVKDMPRQVLIGATHDSMLAYRMGVAIAAQCRRLGVHINFAPVVDVNNNPANPIINARSFGEDKKWVTRLGLAYMYGLQNSGVIACAKHFPGHGDTEADSHNELPYISKSIAQLDTLELYPFRALIKAGLKSLMVAHLEVPALETEPHIPTTLSKNTITNLIKSQLKFNGLVFTDAMNMKGVTKYFQPGEADLRAILAGNDVILFSQDVSVAINKVMEAVANGQITQYEIEKRVKKILSVKYDMGLAHYRPVDTAHVTEDINKYTAMVRLMAANEGITLIRDRNSILDKLARTDIKIGYVGVNAWDSTELYKQLGKSIHNLNPMWMPKGSSPQQVKTIMDTVMSNDVSIVAIHNMSFYPGSSGNHGLDEKQVNFLKEMEDRKDVILVSMGNAYWLRNVCNIRSALIAYEDDSITENITAKILLRTEDARGTLPVTPCTGMVTEGRPVIVAKAEAPKTAQKLKSTEFTEDAGVVNPQALDKLNMFIQRSIVSGAFPGCRILASKNGVVFYNESFGYYEYDKKKRVEKNTIYDVASVTKVLSTTLAVMHLYETGKLNLDKTLGDYLSWTKGTDKAGLKIRNLLLHQAGLKSWIPFYKETLDENGQLRTDLYAAKPTGIFTTQVAKDLYIRSDYTDTIWSRILNSPLENKGRYVYSDLDYYFLAAVVQQITGKRIDAYVDEQFYKPMGLKYTTYNPLKKFKESDIAPTEEDKLFRKQLLRGYVHDQGAALLGGVAGHAGIFSTADDVAAIFQMLLNKGSYYGRKYFNKETVDYFTAYSSAISRRALGFDKPTADKDDAGPAGNRVSGYAFGHQGFTGTCVWADPATGVVFVFLSNRVNPSADNNAINKQSIRTIAQDYIYESLGLSIDHNRDDVYRKQKEKLTN